MMKFIASKNLLLICLLLFTAKGRSQVNVHDDLYYKAIVSEASGNAEKEVRDSFDLYWKLIAGAGALFTFGFAVVGYGQLREMQRKIKQDVTTDLREFVRDTNFTTSLQESIEKKIVGELKQDSARLERQIVLGRLQRMTEKLSGKDSLSTTREEREQLYDYIIKLKDDSAIVSSIEYRDAVYTTLNTFYMSSEWKKIDEIEASITSVTSETLSIILTLVAIYGFRVVGEVPTEQDVVGKLFKYHNLARDKNCLELSAPWIMAYEFWKAEPDASEKISKLFDALSLSSLEDQKRFIRIIEEKCDVKNIAGAVPQPRHYAIAKKFLDIVTAYKVQLDKIKAFTDAGPSSENQSPA